MPITDLEVARLACRAGVEVVRSAFGRLITTEFKSDANPVTEVDRRSEDAIISVIRRHRGADSVLAEESGGEGWDRGRVWIIDPLDGTVNFIHEIPHVSVSVALWEDGRPLVGVVTDVMHSEEFTAAMGGGAFLNGERIEVSVEARLSHSLIATGFAYDRNLHAAGYADTLGSVLSRVQGIRRFGSAALDLAWVAVGRYEGYWEFGIAPWDSAAGVLLITEAGGTVTNHHGDTYCPDDAGVVSSNGRIHTEFLGEIKSNLPSHLR
jgi:myo-inositol-1(or 4)-monophosphatase